MKINKEENEMTKIKCECKGKLKLLNTRYRKKGNNIKRYYQCTQCNKKVTTIEKIYDGWDSERKWESKKQQILKILNSA